MRCEREHEVKDLLGRGHWPQASGEELRVHVAGCGKCGDLVMVSQAFRGARATAMQSAPAMAPGLIWWRAQVRRRQSALEQIARPVWGAQIFALAVTVLLGVGLVVVETRRGFDWQKGAQALHLEALLPMGGDGLEMVLLAACVGLVAVLGGVVVYLGMERR
ncbi:hypothetical protein SAMN05421771_3798 [Granulicella pectinivorans]|uniref:Zinc-finger n=1 Tax=Granulicella pectinivorans TaxID=474950 RepID=A0A1I6MYH0_9BACT|nr:hypothetical protein [Granulicella pectinivorans]SFS20743.1 hypothetical protein SAMN05421771_3798 [Granulicella pectinivorans]